MDREEKIKYWLTPAKNDWVVANHLLEKGDYPYALFFGHLTLEFRKWLLLQIKS